MARTPKPVVTWPIDSYDARVVLDSGTIAVFVPEKSLGDYKANVLYLALAAARRARRAGVVQL